MSTKIFSGYRMVDGVSPFDVLAEVREVVRPALVRANFQEVLDASVDAFDGLRNENSFGVVFRRVIVEETGSGGSLSFCKNAQIVLLSDPVDGGLYSMFFGLRCEELFASLSCVAGEFGYWDNSDSYPVGVSSHEEWLGRLAVWQRVLNFSESVEVQGLTVRVLSDFELRGFSSKTILGLLDELVLPSDESRLLRIAQNLFITDRLIGVEPKDVMSGFMEAMSEFCELEDKSMWLEVASPFLKPISFDLLRAVV